MLSLTLVKKLKDYQKGKGISIEDVARKINVSYFTIYRWFLMAETAEELALHSKSKQKIMRFLENENSIG